LDERLSNVSLEEEMSLLANYSCQKTHQRPLLHSRWYNDNVFGRLKKLDGDNTFMNQSPVKVLVVPIQVQSRQLNLGPIKG